MKIGKARYYSDVTDRDWEIFAQELDISHKFVELELKRQKQLLPVVVEKISEELNCKVAKLIFDKVIENC